MENEIGFLEEAPQTKSANRLVFVFGMFWLMGYSTLILLIAKEVTNELLLSIGALFTTIASVLSALKLIQKRHEKK